MMSSSNACRFFLFSLLSLSPSARAETVRGAQRELKAELTVDLGTAKNYAILTKAGISTVPTSVITGDIGVSPINAEAMTGFDLILDSEGKSSSSSQVDGTAYASDYAASIPAILTTAVSDMESAYTDAAGRTNTDAARINLGAGILGGAFGGSDFPLTAGVYTFGSDVTLTGNIHFAGSAIDIFIIQITGNLVQDANFDVILSNGALAENIFWQVAGNVAVGAGAHMEGILLVKTDVTFVTGSSLNGRVLAQTACNLEKATITVTE
jgi:hypothetical protein